MLVNNTDLLETDSNIKFIDYTGKYPNLCSGILTLSIDGKIVKFGHNYSYYDYDTKTYTNEDPNNPNFDKFWSTGGSCGFKDNYINSYINNNEWIIDINDIPKKYQKYATIIDELFNNNVPHGCCGGCL